MTTLLTKSRELELGLRSCGETIAEFIVQSLYFQQSNQLLSIKVTYENHQLTPLKFPKNILKSKLQMINSKITW